MRIEGILAILILVCTAANFFHWRWHAAEKLFCCPETGWLRDAFIAWFVAILIAAVLFLARLVPSVVSAVLMSGFCIATQVYSIWFRQVQKRGMM